MKTKQKKFVVKVQIPVLLEGPGTDKQAFENAQYEAYKLVLGKVRLPKRIALEVEGFKATIL